jgi:thiol:disulfide interchange protein DsbD
MQIKIIKIFSALLCSVFIFFSHTTFALTPNSSFPSSQALSMTTVSTQNITADSEQGHAEQILKNKNWVIIIAGFLGFGFLLAFTPCVLPMIPILVSIIVGQGTHITTRRAFSLSLAYVLAMAVTYSVAGIIAGLLGSYVQAYLQNVWVIGAFSLLFVLLALSLLGFYELQMPNKLQRKVLSLSNNQSGGTYIGVAMMGILATLIASPCVTAPLIGVLSYIAKTGDATLGALALFALGLGMGIPLLIIGTLGGKFLPKAGAWLVSIKMIFGFLMLGLAIWLIERIIPAAVSLLLWSLLIFTFSIYLGVFTVKPKNVLAFSVKIISILLLSYSMILAFSIYIGNHNSFNPLQVKTLRGSINQPALTFKHVKNRSELSAAMVLAKAEHRPVMLDFYADWCPDCKALDKNTFSDLSVIKLLNNFNLLRGNLTDAKAEDNELAKSFDILGPPRILFFDENGKLMDVTFVGYVGPVEFSQTLQKILR